MSKEILQDIIYSFAPDKFSRFFRDKNRSFSPRQEDVRHYNDENFKNGLKLGEIQFTKTEKLVVCAFQVKQSLSERSGKKAQYEKGKKILKDTQSDAGIFIFYDQTGNFRFSLIYPETIGNRRQWSSFRRFTYFVSNDPDVTNKTFLQRIGQFDFSTVEKVKEAFALGPVTEIFYKDFFVEYNKLVNSVKKANKLAENEKIRDFVLLFAIRIIFSGFIQKRRWLGNNDKFVQDLLRQYLNSKSERDTFYKKWVSVLFFEAFNKKFSPKIYFPQKLNADFQLSPYLNGGLFREKLGYDDEDYFIPDADIKSFFDFIFSYNFTIEENSYDDEDLQLNPEFLGIIFERLVNKADGAVYTPRTEVDLMCRLSLVKWLQKNITLAISTKNLYELFFREGEKQEDQKQGSFSEKEIKEIIGCLENTTICDPAVGSGAFLVGMMQVLDEIEQNLKARINQKDENAFERKKRIIAQSLYGVEVKEWAVWICQLRLWLSLFIEAPDEMRHSFEPILPSLDFKVRQGDSLVQRIGSKSFPVLGHALIGESIKRKITQLKNLKNEYFGNKTPMKDWEVRQRELAIYDEILQIEISEKMAAVKTLKNIKPENQLIFMEINKEPIQKEIDFNEDKVEQLENEIKELQDQKNYIRKDKPLVWNIEFAEIFVEFGGFDIVIGNPPYVRQEDIADPTGKIKDKKQYRQLLEEMVRLDFPNEFPPKYKINAKSDLYTYFYIRALRLLNPQGIHTFICSNSWLDAGYGVWLQKFLLERAPIELIIDNHAKRSFEAADVNTIISVIHAPMKKINQDRQIKFVAFKKPFEEAIFTEYLCQIEKAVDIISNDIFRVYPIAVNNLEDAGTEYEDEAVMQKKMHLGRYVGDKWGGKYLRTPDIFFTLLDKGKKYIDAFDRYFIGERYLNTGGADGFFILTQVQQRNKNYANIVNDKILKTKIGGFNGDVESKYLKVLIKDQTKKDKSIEIKSTDAWCLVVDTLLKNEKVTEYIKWGAKQGYDQRSVTKNQKPWFKPTNQMRSGAEVLLPRSFNDIFVTHYNPYKYLSLRYYRLHPKGNNVKELVSFLNSTLFWFMFESLGNKNQGQGVLDFYMEHFLRMRIPIVINKNIVSKFSQMKERQVKSIFDECGINPSLKVPIEEQEPRPLPDRAELDKIIFDALDLTGDERKDVYRAVCRLVWNRISKAKSV